MAVDLDDLHSIPLFAALGEGDLRQISRWFEELSVRPKTVLFVDGAHYSGLHIIKSGRLKLIRESHGKEQILAILGIGEPVDPIPLLDGGNHTSTAKSMESANLYRIAPDLSRALLEQYPPVLSAMLNVVSGRLRKLAALANDLVFKDVAARVCQALLQEASIDGQVITRDMRSKKSLTRQELASLVGTSREVAWRAIKKLERDGLIRIQDHEILIVDVERMRAIV